MAVLENEVQFGRFRVAIPQPKRRCGSFEHLSDRSKNVSEDCVHLRLSRKNVESLFQRLIRAREFGSVIGGREASLFKNRNFAGTLGEMSELNRQARLLGERLSQFNLPGR